MQLGHRELCFACIPACSVGLGCDCLTRNAPIPLQAPACRKLPVAQTVRWRRIACASARSSRLRGVAAPTWRAPACRTVSARRQGWRWADLLAPASRLTRTNPPFACCPSPLATPSPLHVQWLMASQRTRSCAPASQTSQPCRSPRSFLAREAASMRRRRRSSCRVSHPPCTHCACAGRQLPWVFALGRADLGHSAPPPKQPRSAPRRWSSRAAICLHARTPARCCRWPACAPCRAMLALRQACTTLRDRPSRTASREREWQGARGSVGFGHAGPQALS